MTPRAAAATSRRCRRDIHTSSTAVQEFMSVIVLPLISFAVFPAPFSRPLNVSDPPLHGSDVTILQQLLRRIDGKCALACGCGCSYVYDSVTADSVACFANRSSGDFDENINEIAREQQLAADAGVKLDKDLDLTDETTQLELLESEQPTPTRKRTNGKRKRS